MLSVSPRACSVCTITLMTSSEIPEISWFNAVIFAEVPSAIMPIFSASFFVFSMISRICWRTSVVAVRICSVSFLYAFGIAFSTTMLSEKSPDANCLSIWIGASIFPISPAMNTATNAMTTKTITAAIMIMAARDCVTFAVGTTTPSFHPLPSMSDTAK